MGSVELVDIIFAKISTGDSATGDHHGIYYYTSCHANIIQSPHLTAYDSAHNGDESTEIEGRHQRYCTLVGARKSNDHPSLRGSSLGHEEASPCQASGARHQYSPLPCPGLFARVPEDPVIM